MNMFMKILALGIGMTACSSPSKISRELGAQCSGRAECDERCLRGPDYPGGMCSISCENNADCPSDAYCVDKEGGVCLFACTLINAQDCNFLGGGWRCKSKDLRSNTQEQVNVCFGE